MPQSVCVTTALALERAVVADRRGRSASGCVVADQRQLALDAQAVAVGLHARSSGTRCPAA